MQQPVIIATRESRLALWQAEHVRDLLAARFGWRVELLGMTTRGDQILDRTLSKVGGKGLFVKELETALEEGRAHLAVHSLKDVPMDLPDGFVLAAVLEREDPRDAFVSPRFETLDALPHGAKVGPSICQPSDRMRSPLPSGRTIARWRRRSHRRSCSRRTRRRACPTRPRTSCRGSPRRGRSGR